LEKPSAARRIIFARTTRKYSNVYLTALDVSSRASARVREIEKGLFLDIETLPSQEGGYAKKQVRGSLVYL